MRVYLNLGKIIGGAAPVNEENLQALLRRWYYSDGEIWKKDDDRIISIKILDIIHSLLLVNPNVNGGEYFALIDSLGIRIFYSRNGINEVLIRSFFECKEEVDKKTKKLPMFKIDIFSVEKLSSAFTGFGIFETGIRECDPNSLDFEIMESAREFWEKISKSASKESSVVHAVKKGGGASNEGVFRQ